MSRAMRVMITGLAILTACSDPGASPAPPAPSPAPTASVSPAPAPALAPAPPPAPLPILGGDVVWIDAHDDVATRTLLVRIPDEPRPDGPAIGTADAPQGVMQMRLLAEMPERYARVAIAGTSSVCTADVIRTRRLHGQREHYDDDTDHNESTYLGLDFEGCADGMAGVAGAEITVRSLLVEGLGVPAPAELAAVVQPLDDDYADPLPLEAYRLLALPERDLRIVRGNGAFVLGQGVRAIGAGSLNGMLETVIEAGHRTFFVVSTPSESWLEPLERVVTDIHRARCVVADASGTPLNVRREPRASAEAIATLENGAEIEGLVGPSDWTHVATTPHGWAHDGGLRCTDLPPDPWP